MNTVVIRIGTHNGFVPSGDGEKASGYTLTVERPFLSATLDMLNESPDVAHFYVTDGLGVFTPDSLGYDSNINRKWQT